MLNKTDNKESKQAAYYLAKNVSKNRLNNIKNIDMKELVNNNLELESI
ncbi:hypothetical protein BX659_10214 [Orenia metallireducens]|jgi:hypothetical protein|uniref:Uncharacterized protein n=1 Tax=Orenia metallireducens TaxID=1413210 RepID=A0A285F1Q0_9FIRM|nr:hypothetical protein [Orenia metallireducens]PRX34699.1 hypothetical protein BX659_10214 [Orenia metallireducens]SNY05230.1 hypothetical protein SAMN06265827_10114 [Orenia metallireducens]